MPGSSTVHGDEEFVVVACTTHLVEQELHGLDRIHVGEQLPQNPDTRQPCLGNEQLLAARTRLDDVDGGPDTAVSQLTVENELHVTGAFELLEDDVVHPAAGVDERGTDDGERSTLLHIARRAEEPLGSA